MGDPYWSEEKFVNTTDNVFRNTVDNVFFDSSTPNASSTRPTVRGGTKVVLPTTGLGIGVVNKDYGRKPYLVDSYHEMMRRPTYRGVSDQLTIRQSDFKVLMRQSEFEKPYLEDDYQEMQHFYPIPPLPPWGDWDWIPPEGTTGGPPGAGPGFPGAPGGLPVGVPLDFCSITCWGDHAYYGDDCDEAVGECHLSVSSLGIVGSWVVSGPVNKIDEFSDYIYFSPVKPGESARSIKIYADWDNIPLIDNRKEADFAVVYTDERGNVCKSEFTLSCVEKCDCYKEPVFIYDTGNPTSVAPEASVSIRVENGCPPFGWSVTGTGFTFGQTNTDGTTNQLIAGSSACGMASITVTDNCGATVTGAVACTAGTWYGCSYEWISEDCKGPGCTGERINDVEIAPGLRFFYMLCSSCSTGQGAYGATYSCPSGQGGSVYASDYCNSPGGTPERCTWTGATIQEWDCE